jgi:signal transduction histidine kinase
VLGTSTRLFRTSTFRLSLLYVGLFSASVLVLLAFIYWTTVRVIDGQTMATIEAEIRGLAEQYRARGLRRLVAVIEERSGLYGDPDSVYLLTDPSLRPLAGNLSAWPIEAEAPESQWVDISATRAGEGDDEGETRDIRARNFVLPEQFRLLVGRDPRGRSDFEGLIVESLGWALAITLALGLLGGLFISRNMLRRVDAVRETSQRIVRGDLSRRMPVTNVGDEFDRLSSTVNEMLDEIEKLMTGLRTVTDSVAHDLRSPLTRLKSRMELALLEGSADRSSYREALERAIAETDGILRTFNVLMEIARAESGTSQITMSPVDLRAVIKDMVELYRPLCEEKGLALEATFDEEMVVTGHEQFLSQLIANLIDNALKYTETGRITVALSRTPLGKPCLAVDDTGPGIPAAERERVLQRFVRLDTSRTTSGSGLGLSLVAGVASLHQAKLVLGESPLGGLCVSVTFPAA